MGAFIMPDWREASSNEETAPGCFEQERCAQRAEKQRN